jgi:hypothetical protein
LLAKNVRNKEGAMKRILLASTLIFTPLLASAFILPTRTILQKTSENAGSGIYAVEQDVQFANGDDTIRLRETWLIDSDRTMRVTVTGTKELQNTFRLQFLYTGGQRWTVVNNNRKSEKAPEDFLEKYLNFRSPEIFASTLSHMKILPTGAYNKKPLGKSGNDYKYEPESWVRYSRTGGVPNYAFGTPTPEDDKSNNPGLWIEQDQFVVRKIRLPSQVEMTADSYNQRNRKIRNCFARSIQQCFLCYALRHLAQAPFLTNQLCICNKHGHYTIL